MRQPSSIVRCISPKTSQLLGAVRWLGLEAAPPSIVIVCDDGSHWLWPIRPELRGGRS